MAMHQALSGAFNDQVTSELAASITYLQMAAWFDSEELPGMAHWMYQQAAEETGHARRFIDFVVDRGAKVVVGDIPAPTNDFSGPVAAFEAALAHEREVTAQIRNLYQLASEHSDLESFPLLHQFLAEQVEEESTVETILAQLRRAGDSQPALLLIDRDLGARSTAS